MRRRLPAVAAALAAAALALGCGGDEKSASSPLDDALGYLPRDAVSVVVVETDPEHAQWKQVNELISKFQIADQIRQEGQDRVSPGQLDFDADLRPQLGNEVVVGRPAAKPKRSRVLAVKLKDPERARRESGGGERRRNRRVAGPHDDFSISSMR